MPYKVWVAGEEVLAADFNDYVQEQVVATFPTAAARTAAIPAPTEGMVSWLNDSNSLDVHDGIGWRGLPKGELAGVNPSSNTGGFNNGIGTQLNGFHLDFVPGVNRIIHVSLWMQINYVGTTGVYILLKRNGALLTQGVLGHPAGTTDTVYTMNYRFIGDGSACALDIWAACSVPYMAQCFATPSAPAHFAATDVGRAPVTGMLLPAPEQLPPLPDPYIPEDHYPPATPEATPQ